MRIYLTQCSKEKSLDAKANELLLPPEDLYTEEGIQSFIKACKQLGVEWAILSDKYGVFLPNEKHEYYEKPPSSVTSEEEAVIIAQFDERLAGYDEIWFYVRQATFHPFYERVLKRSAIANRVHIFTNIREIY